MFTKNKSIVKTLLWVFTIVYTLFLFYAVFFARRRRHLHVRLLNLEPLKKNLFSLSYIQEVGKFNYFSNTFGNIFLFVPLPFILISFLKIRRFSSVLLFGFLFSLSIEVVQYIFIIGVADIDDVIFNSLGAALGYLCYMLCKKFISTALVSSTRAGK